MGELKLISRKNNIILIAPHGRPEDDMNTGELARRTAEQLECYAAINEKYRRPDKDDGEETDVKKLLVDCNNKRSINTAKIKAKWLDKIDGYKKKLIGHGEVPGTHDKCFIFMIHGAKDDNVKSVSNNKADVLLGVGRVKENSEKEERFTVTEETLQDFIKHLQGEGVSVTEARAAKIGSGDIENRYAGHDINNLNQHFVARNKNGDLDPKVQSFQLEFKLTGYRETDDDIKNTARRLAAAIGKLTGVVPVIEGEFVEEEKNLPFDSQKVNEAVHRIVGTFQTAMATALIDVGNYLIDTFFGSDYESASNPRNVEGDASILQIQKQLRQEIGSPSQSWVYDAVKVSAYSNIFEKEDFQTFGKLGVSQRVKLAYYSGDIEEKKHLAQLSYDGKWSVRDLSKEIKSREFDKMPVQEKLVSLLSSPSKFLEACSEKSFHQNFEKLDPENRREIQDKAKKEAEKIGMEIQKLKELKKQYEALVK